MPEDNITATIALERLAKSLNISCDTCEHFYKHQVGESGTCRELDGAPEMDMKDFCSKYCKEKINGN